jgi:hypothetical protein
MVSTEIYLVMIGTSKLQRLKKNVHSGGLNQGPLDTAAT